MIGHKGYYLVSDAVEDAVFHELSEAKKYCLANGLDPDRDIQTNDPDVFRKCREIARVKLYDLDKVKERITKRCNEVREEAEKRAKRRDEYNAEISRAHEIGWDSAYLQGRVDHAFAVYDGICEAIQIVDDMRKPYFEIVYHVRYW